MTRSRATRWLAWLGLPLLALGLLVSLPLAILSNGNPGMLDALVRNSGLDRVLDAVISV